MIGDYVYYKGYMIRQIAKRRLLMGVLLIGCLALMLRLPALGRFMTVDEENWMLRSQTFMSKILDGDIAGTFLSSHPGASGMWLMGSGIVLKEKISGIEMNEGNLIIFRKASTLPVMLATSLLIGLIAYALLRLWGPIMGGMASVLLAVDPYLTGMSEIAHLDALLALFMLCALLYFVLYVRFNKHRWLVASAVFFGLALGTKLVLALWLLPFLGLFALITQWRGKGPWQTWKRWSVEGVGYLFLAFVVLVLLWPTMLTKKDLQVGYIARDTSTVISDEHVALEVGADGIVPVTFYLRTVLGRVPAHIQILLIGFILVSARYLWFWWRSGRTVQLVFPWRLAVWLLVYAVGFLLLITLAAKKGDRYALPALVVFPLLGGWVFGVAWEWLTVRFRLSSIKQGTSLFVLGAAVVSIPLLWSPYAIAYNNSLFSNIRPYSQQGWGEGLEQAAAWLNERPRSEDMYIATWYPSVVKPFFKGKTMSLSSRHDYRVMYLVTYRNMRGRAPDDQASNVLDEVRDKEPVYTVYVQGVPYAWIYETYSVGNFTRHVGEITGQVEVGQTVRPAGDGWSDVEIGFATFSSRANDQDVILHVRQSPEAKEDLRTVRVNAAKIVDNEWHSFEFEPIEHAAGREFYVSVTSPTSVEGNAVTVRYIDDDVSAGQMYLNGEPKLGDIAYRIEK